MALSISQRHNLRTVRSTRSNGPTKERHPANQILCISQRHSLSAQIDTFKQVAGRTQAEIVTRKLERIELQNQETLRGAIVLVLASQVNAIYLGSKYTGLSTVHSCRRRGCKQTLHQHNCGTTGLSTTADCMPCVQQAASGF